MALGAAQRNAFATNGFVVVDDLLGRDALAPLIRELEAWLDERALALQAGGHLDDLATGLPFATRYARLFAQTPLVGTALDIAFLRGPALFALLTHPRLLDAVASLVGPEVLLNPIHHLRAKIPQPLMPEAAETYFNVPWHQDSGVMWEEADPVPIVSVWIPLVDATPDNGCMEAMPGVARGGHLPHQAEGGTTIVPEALPDVAGVPLACPAGGAVFQDKFTPHRSTPNRTDAVRWSVDVRFQPAGQPTGRPFHPAFLVRSERTPDDVCDHTAWDAGWAACLADLAGKPPPAPHRVVR